LTDKIDIRIGSTYDASGARAALKDTEALSKAQPRGGGGAAVAADAAKAERAILAQAQAQARLQTVTGDLSGAQQTLSAAIGRLPPGSMAATRALTSLAQVENKVTAEANRAAAAQQKLAQSSGGLSGQIATATKSVEQLATGLAGLKVVQTIDELARTSAQAGLVKQRFDQLAESAGTTGDAIMTALRSASGNEIADMSLQLAANKAALLGVADSAGELGVLMEIARDRAQAMGISTEFAFDSIVTGLGRGSALILDNIGITVEVTEVNAAYAASLGKTADQLTETEKKQALINAVVLQGKKTIEETGGAVETAASKYAKFDTAVDNAKIALGGLAGITLAPLAEDAANLINALTGVGSIESGASSLLDTFLKYGAAVAPLRQVHDTLDFLIQKSADLVGIELPDFSPLQASIDAWRDLLGIQTEAEVQAAATAAAADQLAAAISYQSPTMIQAAAAHQEATFAADMHRAAMLDDRQESILAAEAMGIFSQSSRDAAAASLIAGQEAELQGAKTDLLRLQTEAAVDEFLRLNPTLDANSVAAAAAAAGLSPLQAQLAQTTIRANEAQNALSAFQRQAAIGAGVAGLTPLRGLTERGPVGGALGQGANSSAAGQRFRTNALINSLYPTATPARAPRASGGGGGAAAAARVSESERAGEQLAAIEQRTQDQLAAIDERGAERRAAAFRKLNEDIATSSADLVASQEANDLDLIGAEEKDLARLAARESAEAKARIKNAEAVAEAQKMAAEGNAEEAQATLDIRQQAISKQQSLDEKYAERQAELAGNDEALRALDVQYAEATAKAKEAEDTRLMLVQAAAAQRVAEVDEEKARVIAAAQEQAEGVKGATEGQRAAVVGSLDAQGAAFAGWARAAQEASDKVVAAADRSSKAIAGIPKPSAATGADEAGEAGGVDAGGGAMLARGGRALSGGGRAASGGGSAVATLSEAHVILDQILTLGGIAKKYIKPIELYKQTLGTAIELLTAAADFHTAAQQAAVSPISPALVQQLVDEARWVLDLTRHALVPTNERQVEIFERNAAITQSSISIVSDMAELRQTMTGALLNSSPFDVVAVVWLVRRAEEFTALVLGSLLPLTIKQAEGVARWAESVSGTVSVVSDLATLRETVTQAMKNSAPFDSKQVAFLIGRAKEFFGMLRDQLVPTTEATAAGFDAYATSVGASVAIIGGIAGLRQTVTEAMAESQPFDSKQIAFLVGRAKEFTAMVRDQLVPTTEEQSEEVQRYADAVMASAAALKAPLELSGNLFADYVSPSDAQLDLVANDARRFVDRLAQAAATYSKEGLEASKAYAEGIGATFTAAKDGLLFFDALRSGDFTPQPAALAQFEAGTMALMDTAARLGARAATIPAGDIAALGSITTVLNDQAAMLINMSAVPFGNLGAIAGSYGGQQTSTAGGSTTYQVNIYNPPAGLDVGALTRQVKEVMRQEMGGRRS
jgi:hypothetical protein